MSRRKILLVLATLAAGCSWDKLRDRAEHPLESPASTSSSFLYPIGMPFPKNIVFQNAGVEVFSINEGGRVILAPGVTLDSASLAFWNSVRAAGARGCGPEVKP